MSENETKLESVLNHLGFEITLEVLAKICARNARNCDELGNQIQARKWRHYAYVVKIAIDSI